VRIIRIALACTGFTVAFAAEGYAKRTREHALAATRKRHAHMIALAANSAGTEFQNEQRNAFQNDGLSLPSPPPSSFRLLPASKRAGIAAIV